MNTDGEGKKREKTIKTVIIILLMILIFILGGLAGHFLVSRRENGFIGGVEFNVETDQSGGGESETSHQGVTIPGVAALIIPADETEVTVNFFNPEENDGLYYLTFELKVEIEGSYRSLYTSALVEAGKRIEKITLSAPLEKGEYNAVIHIQPYRTDGLTPTNNADIIARLTAE